jgi:hypothetical protein
MKSDCIVAKRSRPPCSSRRLRWTVRLGALIAFAALGIALLRNGPSSRGSQTATASGREMPAGPTQAQAIAGKIAERLEDLCEPSRVDHEAGDVAQLNLLCAEGLPGADTLDVPHCLATRDQWAARVKAETERHLYRYRGNPQEYEHSEAYFRMLMMAVVLAEDFGVHYNPARAADAVPVRENDGFFADSRDVFLHGLLGPRRMGTCSSMPVLYLALGRRLGYPLKLVTTKGHLFLRWEGPTERFNLEATGRGMNRYDDEHYKQWPFPLTEQEIAENGYLKSLSAGEELAVFLTIRAQCLTEAARFADAMAALDHAVRLAPGIKLHRLLLAQARLRVAASASASPALAPQPEGDRSLGRVETASESKGRAALHTHTLQSVSQ